jgi:hypothetical protein
VNFDCFQAIHKRAALLASVSTTLIDWHQSIYGQLLRITDPLTLAKVRQFWVKYSGFANLSTALDNIREKFMQCFVGIHEEKSRGKSLSGMRSVGATCMDPQAMESVTEEFERFWKSGVIGGLRELTEAATYISPLFVHSNIGADECVIHYGTDPILGFHCASVFAETISAMSSVSRYSQRSTLDENVNRLARSAMLEFKQWCAAFQSVARSALLDPSLLKISPSVINMSRPITSWDTDNLARSLVSVYNEMFKDEDFTSQRPVGCSQLSPFPRWRRKAEELNLNLRENVTPNFSCQNHSILLELRPISLP